MPTPTEELIAKTTLASAAASCTFSNISGNYTDLILVQSSKYTLGSQNTTLQVGNGTVDTGTNYSQTYLTGNGTSASSGRVASSSIYAGTTGDTNFSPIIWQLSNYSNTLTYKTILHKTNDAAIQSLISVDLWRSNSAINIITLTTTGSTFVAGSTFALYGVL